MTQCSKCGNPLHIISGGNKIVDGKIVMVHVFGCLNNECELKMQEQSRTENEQDEFKG